MPSAPRAGARTSDPTADDRDGRPNRGEYPALIGRVRDVAGAAIPSGAIVAVASRGDDELIRLDGPVGWHFPQTPNGTYAGFNPGSSGEAIRELEAVRGRGARYLLIPATASWWLDHYVGFRLHLERRYPLLVRDEDTCAIYSLGPLEQARDGTGSDRDEDDPEGLIRQIRELVAALVPPGATVAVVSRGDDSLVRFQGHRGWHLPQTADGSYDGRDPANSTEAVAQLKTLTKRGARYLLVPSSAVGWLESSQGFRRYLDRNSRLVAMRRHVCSIYELARSGPTWADGLPLRPWRRRRG